MPVYLEAWLIIFVKSLNTWMIEKLDRAGSVLVRNMEFAGFTILLLLKSLYYFKNIFGKRHEIIKQLYYAGVKTFPVISIVALFTGMVLGLQMGIEMKAYHQEIHIGGVVIATLTREMAPFTAAIILIASVGSAMAAELGTMKVSEEIDALEIMSISVEKYLVMPRIAALAVMMPVATVYVNVMGSIGGAVVAKSHLNISYGLYYHVLLEHLHFKAVYVGLLKAFVFGLGISSISCAQGLRAENGALGVGRATRDAVVASFIMVLIIGYYITEFFFRFGL